MAVLRSNLATSISDVKMFLLRKDDEEECRLLGLTGYEALQKGIESSERAYVVTIDHNPLAVWGWSSRPDHGVNLWLLTSELVEDNRKVFVREAARLLGVFYTLFPFVCILVGKKHKKARRLLFRLAFEEVDFGNEDFLIAIGRHANGR